MAALRRAPIAATATLTAALTVALFAIVSPVVHGLIDPTVLPAPFPEQNQDAETLLFVVGFLILLPASLLLAARLVASAHDAGVATGELNRAAALLAGLLVGLVVAAKASSHLPWGDGSWVAAAGAALWLLVSAASWPAVRRGRLLPWLPPAAIAAGLTVLVLLGVACFADLRSVSVTPLLVMGVVTAGLLAARIRLPAPPPPWGRVIDALTVCLLLLAVPNLVIFGFGDPARATDDTILQFHQDFFLGPANQVLGGRGMLVGTLSQYGVGSIYFLAAIFELVPIGNGTLGLIEGLLSALTFCGGFLALRLAGVRRTIACLAMVVAVVVLVYGLVYPLGGLLQHGAIRFGMPMGVIVAAVAEARSPRLAVPARALALLTVALASIWALEAFAYTLITLAAAIAAGAAIVAREGRLGWVLRRVGAALAACLVAHLLFASITLVAAGELPEWGKYLHTLRSFLAGGIGKLTYDFTPWSPALAVAALYVASAAGAFMLLVRRGRSLGGDTAAVVAIAVTTAYGIALFSYFVNRSADHILAYISLPAVMVVALWLELAWRPSLGAGELPRRAATAACAGTAVLLVAIAWSGAGEKFSESALAHALPGGESMRTAVDRLWDPPELAKGASEGERLLREEMPGEDESLVLTSADLGVEVLMRTNRINRIPLADPWEESLVPSAHLPDLEDAVESLQPGDLMLTDRPARKVFAGYVSQPHRNPLVNPFSRSEIVPTGIAVLQEWALKEISLRFRLQRVAGGADGMEVDRLVPVPRGG